MTRHPDKASLFYPFLVASMREFAIDANVHREAAFLATIAHETGEFQYLSEIWGPTPTQQQYEPPSQKATDLGNTQKGDGYRFRGRGPIEITGRANYATAGSALGIDLITDSDKAKDPAVGTRVSCWWWNKHGCNELADIPDFEKVTRRVNGGLNGWEERLAYYTRALELLKPDFSNVQAGSTTTAP